MYSLPALAELAAKIYCIVHLIRNGRSFLWIWLILFFPFGGPLIYFIVEIWPELRSRRSSGPAFALPQTSARAIAKLREELEFSNTIENRVRLAQALGQAGRFPEALETLNECLRGAFKDDPLITYELAQIQFAAGAYADALATLAKLDELGTKHAGPVRVLLQARAHEALGDAAEADANYREALTLGSGEEARCRYASFLDRAGRGEEAQALYAEIVNHARRGDGLYRRFNREWIAIAKQRLARR